MSNKINFNEFCKRGFNKRTGIILNTETEEVMEFSGETYTNVRGQTRVIMTRVRDYVQRSMLSTEDWSKMEFYNFGTLQQLRDWAIDKILNVPSAIPAKELRKLMWNSATDIMSYDAFRAQTEFSSSVDVMRDVKTNNIYTYDRMETVPTEDGEGVEATAVCVMRHNDKQPVLFPYAGDWSDMRVIRFGTVEARTQWLEKALSIQNSSDYVSELDRMTDTVPVITPETEFVTTHIKDTTEPAASGDLEVLGNNLSLDNIHKTLFSRCPVIGTVEWEDIDKYPKLFKAALHKSSEEEEIMERTFKLHERVCTWDALIAEGFNPLTQVLYHSDSQDFYKVTGYRKTQRGQGDWAEQVDYESLTNGECYGRFKEANWGKVRILDFAVYEQVIQHKEQPSEFQRRWEKWKQSELTDTDLAFAIAAAFIDKE